jgi:16S rRNA (cytosine1402-N4)-methyltransferase
MTNTDIVPQSNTGNKSEQPKTEHIPVLLEHVLTYLNPQAGESYLDVTAGYGGHARRVLERTQNFGDAVLVDRDQNAVTVLDAEFAGQGTRIIQTDFLNASRSLLEQGKKFDMILADLGVSSPHLNQADRGFAISLDGPLDMRMDQHGPLTAADIVNTYSVDQLADIIHRYGEDPKSRTIAKLIVYNRPSKEEGCYRTTTQLAQIVSRAWPGHSKVHPATRTFQALRIAVNDELRLVEDSLPVWVDLLAPNGRLVVISFHSLEDRLVKRALAELSGDRYDARLQLLTKRPVVAEQNELVSNPRARSAKLRAAAKK